MNRIMKLEKELNEANEQLSAATKLYKMMQDQIGKDEKTIESLRGELRREKEFHDETMRELEKQGSDMLDQITERDGAIIQLAIAFADKSDR